MPYYDYNVFKHSLFDYHQQQLLSLSSNSARSTADTNNSSSNSNRQRNIQNGQNSFPQQYIIGDPYNRPIQDSSSNDRSVNLGQEMHQQPLPNSLLSEVNNRIKYIKTAKIPLTTNDHSNIGNNVCRDSCSELESHYGMIPGFGWIVVGSVSSSIGITLTSIVPRVPNPRMKRSNSRKHKSKQEKKEEDLMNLNVDCLVDQQTNNHTANSSQINPVTVKTIMPDSESIRANYNLKGHSNDVIVTKWNELYQKLATVDSKGNVLIWCKYNEKFTIQTPFHNLSKTVADFQWSNDGKTALICYTDSFILVGSSYGERHWHSMLNLEDYHITCASWTPNDDQLLLGLSNGNILRISLPDNELTESVINPDTSVKTMCWTCNEMNLTRASWILNELKSTGFRPSKQEFSLTNNVASTNLSTNDRSKSFDTHRNTVTCLKSKQIDCSTSNSVCDDFKSNILAVEFSDSTVRLFEESINSKCLVRIDVQLESFVMRWSSNGKILAIAGFNVHTSAPTVGSLKFKYTNRVKFYSPTGVLLHEHMMRYTRHPITAIAWAHNNERLFVAAGSTLLTARVYYGVQALYFQCLSSLQRSIKLPNKENVLYSMLNKLSHMSRIDDWQSPNCQLKVHSTNRENLANSCSKSSSISISYNCHVQKLDLPTELKSVLDSFFDLTIRQPFDEYWSPDDIAWSIPNNGKRIYCTLICFTSEDSLQYANPYIKHAPGQDSSFDSDSSVSEKDKVFVLYVEHQGSLIPILKARRVGYLKPEFVIYSPEILTNKSSQQSTKVSDVTQVKSGSNRPSYLRQPNGPKKFSGFMNKNEEFNLTRPQLGYNFAKSSSESGPSYCSLKKDSSCNKQQAANLSKELNNSDTSSLKEKRNLCYPVVKRTENILHHNTNEILMRQRVRNLALGVDEKVTRYKSSSTIQNEIAKIKSNIWGTKFKLINLRNKVIGQKVLLGSISYKASLLHLQPRQVSLTMRDLSNYCCMCSRHHHSRLSRSEMLAGTSNRPKMDEIVARVKRLNLIDTPNVYAVASPFKSRRVPSRTNRDENQLVPWTFGKKSCDNQIIESSKKSSAQRSGDRKYSTLIAEFNHKPLTPEKAYIDGNILKASTSSSVYNNFNSQSAHSAEPYAKDDVLTLSLDSGDQLRVELSSITQYNEKQNFDNTIIENARKKESKEADDKLNDFLAKNKAIKSIKDITAMIVDLSEKADSYETENEKITQNASIDIDEFITINLDDSSNGNDKYSRRGPSFAYEPPETPVHKPRRMTNKNTFDQKLSDVTNASLSFATNLTPTKGRQFGCSAKKFIESSLRSWSFNKGYQRTDSNGDKAWNEPLLKRRPLAYLVSRSQPSTPLKSRQSSNIDKSFFSMTGSAFERSLLKYANFDWTSSNSDGKKKKKNGLQKHTGSSASFDQLDKMFDDKFDQQTESKRQLDFGFNFGSKLKQLSCAFNNQQLESNQDINLYSTNKDILRRNTDDDDVGDDEDSEYEFSDEEELTGAPLIGGNNLSRSTQCLQDLSFLGGDCIVTVDKDRQQRILKRCQQTNKVNKTRTKKDVDCDASKRSKPFCLNKMCRCTRNHTMSNKPPTWNELSQVYQLDFGGRVTQESAKNMQIDLNGQLALQFGRLDKRTYTLDYKYPFNAVQAMTVALASLTQRLK